MNQYKKLVFVLFSMMSGPFGIGVSSYGNGSSRLQLGFTNIDLGLAYLSSKINSHF